ncbi:MAG: bifunctional methylenetetrahydrofolate dehydrogenase/methenyltetrahydrofolate cyclohydrolase FolD [Nitrospinae bacterium]|nr:bifunctional methylenetetrahydrofolate dehydrogenase/methenyltetrahydrofolate cyclohydrolase FolD [Nitrospinota bacterium]
MAELIDGKKISTELKEELKKEVDSLREKTGRVPGLAVVLIGEDPASAVYVRNKERSCEMVGIASFPYRLPDTTGEEELLALVQELNERKDVDGILVQLPLPKHCDEQKIMDMIFPEKDVDGFHPYNVGKLLMGDEALAACTPKGCMTLLDRYGIDPSGMNAVIIGRSMIVGKPAAAMLTKRNATVTICHSRTQNLPEVVGRADIIVAAIGRAKFVTSDMVKEGAVIIDVGINRVDGKLVGDVDFEECSKKASFITPVPGGVGPMTIATLMENCVTAFKRNMQID